MKSIDWIDQLIRAKALPSDRQAALLLGMTTAAMSQHRRGKVGTLDDQYAYRLEELLELPHGTIVLDQHMEREQDPARRAMWQRLGKLAASAAATVLVVTGLGGAGEVVPRGGIEPPTRGFSIPCSTD